MLTLLCWIAKCNECQKKDNFSLRQLVISSPGLTDQWLAFVELIARNWKKQETWLRKNSACSTASFISYYSSIKSCCLFLLEDVWLSARRKKTEKSRCEIDNAVRSANHLRVTSRNIERSPAAKKCRWRNWKKIVYQMWLWWIKIHSTAPVVHFHPRFVPQTGKWIKVAAI